MIATYALVIVAVLLLVWAVVVYNLLIRDRNRVAQAWSDVDVQLTRRHDLIPQLVEIVKGYAGYERALQTSLADLRKRGELLALVEGYPDLKANQNFLDLQAKLVDTENQIQYARRYYNGAVNLFNNRIQRFPDLLVARPFGFKLAELFELDDPRVAAPPRVALS